VIELAKHVDVILDQIHFVVAHARNNTRADDEASINAMKQIVKALREDADLVFGELSVRQSNRANRLQRNAIRQTERPLF
jgi:hypothetical protein